MNEQLRDALVAAKSGDEEKARMILAEFLRHDPDNVPAWILLSKLATSDVQKAAFLRKVLDIDPDHAYARQALSTLEQAPAPRVAEMSDAGVQENDLSEDVSEAIVAEDLAPEPEFEPFDFEDEFPTAEKELTEPSAESTPESGWTTLDDSIDYEAQADGDTLPPWMPADETVFETPPPVVAEDEDEGELPSWLQEEAAEDWLTEEEEALRSAWQPSEAEDAAASEKAARLARAMASEGSSEVDTPSGRGWLVGLLLLVAAAIFLVLVYVVLTFML